MREKRFMRIIRAGLLGCSLLFGCGGQDAPDSYITGDFNARYALPESDVPNWRTTGAEGVFGPTAAHLPLVLAPAVFLDKTTWKQQRLVAALDFWIDQELNYCHHHIPLWTPPEDVGIPAFRISNGYYTQTDAYGVTRTQTCSPARRVDGAQILKDIPKRCDPEKGITEFCCPDSTANCIDQSAIKWEGVDCSDFTSWVYNFSFGVETNKAAIPTGIGTQACNGEIKNKAGHFVVGDGVLLDINHKNFDNYGKYLKPGDLLYILKLDKSNTTIVHVVVWTGKVWGDIKHDKAYYKEGNGVNFGQSGDRVGGDFLSYQDITAGDILNDKTPLIVDSHFAGPAYRPFMGWYRKHISHVRRIINAEAAKTTPELSKLVFPIFSEVGKNTGIYKSVSPANSASFLTYRPKDGAINSCVRPAKFNDGATAE